MRIDYVVVADGAALDSSGAVSLIRIGTEFAPFLGPVTLKRSILVALTDVGAPSSAGDQFILRAKVTAPNGEVVATSMDSTTVPPKIWENLPGLAQMTLDIQFPAYEPGAYGVKVELVDDAGVTDSATRVLYVVPEDGAIEPRG